MSFVGKIASSCIFYQSELQCYPSWIWDDSVEAKPFLIFICSFASATQLYICKMWLCMHTNIFSTWFAVLGADFVNLLPRCKLLADALKKIFVSRERIVIASMEDPWIPPMLHHSVSYPVVSFRYCERREPCQCVPLILWCERGLLFWCNVRKEARACF